jgi:hypothetical protein
MKVLEDFLPGQMNPFSQNMLNIWCVITFLLHQPDASRAEWIIINLSHINMGYKDSTISVATENFDEWNCLKYIEFNIFNTLNSIIVMTKQEQTWGKFQSL